MKKFNKNSTVAVALSVFLVFSFMGANSALALTPSLGAADTYGVLSSSFTNTTATTVNGSIGYTTGPAVLPTGTHLYDGSGAPYSDAGIAQGSVLATLLSEACTHTFPSGDIDLSLDTTHGPIGVYTPGVYCTTATSAASIGTAGITLSGSGTFIFRIDGAFTTVANSKVTLSGASDCDVFWTPVAGTTLGADSTFAGTVIDAAGITVGANTVWEGRALAFGGTVSTDTATITNSCPAVDIVVVKHTSSGSIPRPVAISYPVTTVVVQTPVVTPVIAPVVIPQLPNTGFPPQQKNNKENIIMLAGFGFLMFASVVILNKKLKSSI